ncbi:hypothetical protein AX16_007377 [Volvariella volvacea WC 439]|nr:hypothetical protein AX16_007377 [Volvariella volvacea WC 439]
MKYLTTFLAVGLVSLALNPLGSRKPDDTGNGIGVDYFYKPGAQSSYSDSGSEYESDSGSDSESAGVGLLDGEGVASTSKRKGKKKAGERKSKKGGKKGGRKGTTPGCRCGIDCPFCTVLPEGDGGEGVADGSGAGASAGGAKEALEEWSDLGFDSDLVEVEQDEDEDIQLEDARTAEHMKGDEDGDENSNGIAGHTEVDVPHTQEKKDATISDPVEEPENPPAVSSSSSALPSEPGAGAPDESTNTNHASADSGAQPNPNPSAPPATAPPNASDADTGEVKSKAKEGKSGKKAKGAAGKSGTAPAERFTNDTPSTPLNVAPNTSANANEGSVPPTPTTSTPATSPTTTRPKGTKSLWGKKNPLGQVNTNLPGGSAPSSTMNTPLSANAGGTDSPAVQQANASTAPQDTASGASTGGGRVIPAFTQEIEDLPNDDERGQITDGDGEKEARVETGVTESDGAGEKAEGKTGAEVEAEASGTEAQPGVDPEQQVASEEDAGGEQSSGAAEKGKGKAQDPGIEIDTSGPTAGSSIMPGAPIEGEASTSRVGNGTESPSGERTLWRNWTEGRQSGIGFGTKGGNRYRIKRESRVIPGGFEALDEDEMEPCPCCGRS